MAATFASSGRGTHVSISLDGSTYVEVFGVKQTAFSGRKKQMEDKTTLLSPGAYVERQATTKDSGTCTLTLFYNPQDPGQLMLAASFDVDPEQLLYVKVQYDAKESGFANVGPCKTFTAYVSEYPDAGSDMTKLTEQAVPLLISGPITTTPGN